MFIYNFFKLKRENDEVFGNEKDLDYEQIKIITEVYKNPERNYDDFIKETGIKITKQQYNGKKTTIRNIKKDIITYNGEQGILDDLKEKNIRYKKYKKNLTEKKEEMLKNNFKYGDEYEKYLQTEHWKKQKQLVKERDKICQKCGSTQNLHVHHKSYKNLWIAEEEINDLVLLCKDCHEAEHLRLSLEKNP